MSFIVQEISQYRTELMGVATLLVIMYHSAGMVENDNLYT